MEKWTIGPKRDDFVHANGFTASDMWAPDESAVAVVEPDPGVDRSLIGELWAEVNRGIAERERSGQALSKPEQRELARALIAEALERRMLSAFENGVELLSAEREESITQAVLASMFDLGDRLETLMADDSIEDIYIAGAGPVVVKLANGRREVRPPVVDSDDQLRSLLQRAGEQSQTTRGVTDVQPWLNTRLAGRARMAALWDVTRVTHVTIRRHRYVDVTLEQLVDMGTLSPAMVPVLRAAVLARLSILVVGGQSTGKTTLLRALARCLPRTERFATLETEAELLLDEIPDAFPGLIPAEERQGMGEQGPSGRPAGEVTLDDIFPQTLRHSLDRIIVGEVRGPEVRAALKAMTRGLRGSMASFHADHPDETILALAALMSEYQPNWSLDAAMLQISQAVDLIVYIDREILPDESELRFVSHIYGVGSVAELGRDTRVPLFAPKTTRMVEGELLRDEEIIDPRGHATGTGAHSPAARAMIRRGRLDPKWLRAEESEWPQQIPFGWWG